jgi:hypothetical protein
VYTTSLENLVLSMCMSCVCACVWQVSKVKEVWGAFTYVATKRPLQDSRGQVRRQASTTHGHLTTSPQHNTWW